MFGFMQYNYDIILEKKGIQPEGNPVGFSAALVSNYPIAGGLRRWTIFQEVT